MDAEKLESVIAEALYLYAEEEGELNVEDIRTFENAMILTSNRGLVISIDGKKFQVEILEA